MKQIQCLHNKKGESPRPGGSMKYKGEGNCYICCYDKEKNKKCRRFYPITVCEVVVKGD